MNVTHAVNGVQCENDLRTVESRRVFVDIVTRDQRDQIAARHVIHDHVQLGERTIRRNRLFVETNEHFSRPEKRNEVSRSTRCWQRP